MTNSQSPSAPDPYVGIETFRGYFLTKKVGEGKIGSVYLAERPDKKNRYACKVIPEKKLKDGWERELQKVWKLKRVPNVVQYIDHGAEHDNNNRVFTYVIFDFIPSINLRDYLLDEPWPLDMAFVENLATTILAVLHSCRKVDIRHGDLHEGNILIEEPDERLVNSPRTVWISDFGYGGSHNEIEPRDDYKQFFSIISTLLRRLDPRSLNPRDKVMHSKLKEFLDKSVLEVDPTQGEFVGNSELLLQRLREVSAEAERESAAAQSGKPLEQPGDYLSAEALGYRANEWQTLFVPEFLAARELLSKNVTVLTGARGCGKTMAFRRLTAFMDRLIGRPSGVTGADQFVGFYVNCRELAEAFPWLPSSLKPEAQQQIIQYFHLAWLAEILKTLGLSDSDLGLRAGWLDGFLTGIFGNRYIPLPKGANVFSHARAFIENEKESCRLSRLGADKIWPLARFDMLDLIQQQLETHVPWIGEKPIYLFLDDYTIPIVPREVQCALNPIIFKRRDKLFFKVSTEAATSFDLSGIRGKSLEIFQDFQLIDLATESLHQNDKAKAKLLDTIFRPRIDRHVDLKGRALGLRDVLGKTPTSNNQLAHQMRENAGQKSQKKQVKYYGTSVFAGMWSSDIRTMIQMFTDILREANGSAKSLALPVASEIQNKVFKTKGGEFLAFAESITDPASWEKGSTSSKPGDPYGTHLVNIVEAFIATSRYELTKGDLVTNEGRRNPKQAFRVEILNKLDLSDDAERYYVGLVRWHIFLQDWRGKSIRGMITPRLYLNRVLIPRANLTFSSRDNIHLTSQEFASLLERPKEFRRYWETKKKEKKQKGKTKDAPKGQTAFWTIENE
jgi:hypothetical protein